MRKALDEARAERSRLQAEAAPLRAERDALLAKIRPLRRQVDAITEQINVIEKPALFDVMNKIGKLAKALGGRSMNGR